MLTPQQVMEAFAKNNLDIMMEAVRTTASRQPQPLAILNPAVYAATIIHELGKRTREEFWATSLTGGGHIIRTHRMYVGTAYASVIRPAEVLKLMLADDAIAYIVAHNHPGEQVRITPSPEDLQSTNNLFKASNLLGIPLMDHVIVGPGQWYSMVEHDQLEEKKDVRKTQVQRPPVVPRPVSSGGQHGEARPR
jgi:DNA repair protein RadC